MGTFVQMGMSALANLVALVVAVVTGIASWILGMRMRRRIRRTLGLEVKSEAELTSLNTWINVENTEEANRGGKLS